MTLPSLPPEFTRGRTDAYLQGKVSAPDEHACNTLVAQLDSAHRAAIRLRNGDVSEGVRASLRSALAALTVLCATDALATCGRRVLVSIVNAQRIRLADVRKALRDATERERARSTQHVGIGRPG